MAQEHGNSQAARVDTVEKPIALKAEEAAAPHRAEGPDTGGPAGPAPKAAPAGSDDLPPGQIDRVTATFPNLIVPIGALLVSTIVIWAIADWTGNYNIVLLAYPLVFGAAGVVLGGGISVQGTLQAFGIPWNAKAVGGIGAAIVAFPLAYLIQPPAPPAAAWVGDIAIRNVPMAEPDDFLSKPRFFVTANIEATASDGDRLPEFRVEPAADGPYGTLSFKLADKVTTVRLRAYSELKKAPRSYHYDGSCTITFYRTDDMPRTPGKVFHSARPNPQVSLSFRPGYVDTLAEARENSRSGRIENNCLEGEFDDDDRAYHVATVQSPLLVGAGRDARRNLRLGFHTEQTDTAAASDPRTAQKRIAQESIDKESIDKELVATEPIVKGPAKEPVDTAPAATTAVHPGPTAALPHAAAPAAMRAPASAPPPARDLASAATCITDPALRQNVVAWVTGHDLDKPQRTDLYTRWSEANCYLGPVLINHGQTFAPEAQALALRLFAGTIINASGIDGNPLYWQPNAAKRDLARPLPAYVSEPELTAIFNLLASDDEPIRAEALRFIKLLPVDQIEHRFAQQLPHLKGSALTPPQKARWAIAANALYYNRMVEWLNLPTAPAGADQSSAVAAIGDDLAHGRGWMHDEYFNERSAKPYEAMLFYAKGIVERELELTADAGKASFLQMLDDLRATADPYPSRPQHIAQALVVGYVTDGPTALDVLRSFRSVKEFDLVRTLDGSAPFTQPAYALYAGPRTTLALPQPVQVGPKDGARLLLQAGDWYLVAGKDRIGWITTSP